MATQSAELISNFAPEEVMTVNQQNGNSDIVRLDEKDLAHWLNEYTLGDLWKLNIMKGGSRYETIDHRM